MDTQVDAQVDAPSPTPERVLFQRAALWLGARLALLVLVAAQLGAGTIYLTDGTSALGAQSIEAPLPVAFDSIANVQLRPDGISGPFYVVQGTATLAFPGGAYLGFLWGSMDPWNRLTITSSLGTVSYTGTDLAAKWSTHYLNWMAAPGESLVSVTLATTQPAFETANWAWRDSPANPPATVPEPSTWLQIGVGFITGIAWWIARRCATDARDREASVSSDGKRSSHH